MWLQPISAITFGSWYSIGIIETATGPVAFCFFEGGMAGLINGSKRGMESRTRRRLGAHGAHKAPRNNLQGKTHLQEILSCPTGRSFKPPPHTTLGGL